MVNSTAARSSLIVEELDNIKYSRNDIFLKFMAIQDQTKIISAKDLGQLVTEDFCPRCFWLQRHFGKHPQIFPGIFSTLDSLTKKSVKRSFENRSCCPDWLSIKNIQRVVDFKKMNIVTEYGDWILTGVPDDIFELTDKSYRIVDYKTAKYTAKQDKLLPMYRVQLNAYAFGFPSQGISPISKLALIYCEPNESLDNDSDFKLSFATNIHEIQLDISEIPKLLVQARKIVDLSIPPSPSENCKGICTWLDRVSR